MGALGAYLPDPLQTIRRIQCIAFHLDDSGLVGEPARDVPLLDKQPARPGRRGGHLEGGGQRIVDLPKASLDRTEN